MEYPKIETTPVESSNLKAIGYDAATKTVQVDFKTGRKYHYQNVPQETFDEFAAAPSVGKHFAAHIKNAFLCVPLPAENE